MDRSFTKLGETRADLEAAWKDRLADAEILYKGGRNAWAIATALYALEIRLKVLICKHLDLQQLPQAFEIHDLDGLLLLAGLSRRLAGKKAAKVKANWDNIKAVAPKLNDIRYTPDANWPKAQATAFLRWLRDPPDGVLVWLSKQ
jgi:hypothetical protein